MQPMTVAVIAGLFSFLAMLIGSVILKKYEQPWVSWMLLSVVALALTLYVHLTFALNYHELGNKFLTSGMVLLALVSLGNFWDIVKLTR